MRWCCPIVIALAAACSSKSTTPCKRAHSSHVQVKRVEEESELMKQWFRHVGTTRSGEVTDPAALAAGVRGDIDTWQRDDMVDGMPAGARRYLDYSLIAADRASLEKYAATLQAVPSEHEIVYENTKARASAARHWRTYYVRSDVLLDDTLFASATATSNSYNEQPTVAIALTDEGTTRWAAITRDAIGHKLAFILDGTVMAAPIIETAITSGQFSLPASSEAEANSIVAKLGCS
jgi:hypothetical protein